MSGFSVMSKEPSIIWAADRLINKRIDSNYYHIKYIEYLDTIVNCGLDCKPFEDICKRMNSGPFGSALLASAYVEKGVPFIRPLNCKNFIVEDNELVFISNEDSIRLKSSRFNSGALIITKIGNGIGDVAIIPRKNDKCNISGNLMGVEIKNSYDNYFVLSFLKSKYGQNQIWQGMMNSAKPKIDMDTIRSIQIPIPSAEIQKYIGDKVRRAEELREEAKRLENEINTFFNEKFSDIYNSIDESKVYHSKFTWKSAENIRDVFNAEYFTLIGDKYEQVIREQKGVYLDDLLKDCFMGKSPSQYADKGPKILKVKNLTNGGLDWSDSDHVDKEFYVKNKRCHLQHGDVFIIPAAHLAKYIGEKVDVYIQGIEGIKYPDAMASGKIIVIRPNFDKVNPIYLCLVMREKFVYHQIQRQVSGITASYYPKDVRQLCIPLIEREKQDMVADKYIEIIKCKEQAKQLIQEAKQDVEDLIEGKFDMSKLNKDSGTESRC